MDNAAFEKYVLDCADTLYRVSMSMLKNEADAQDAVHDAILTAYEQQNKLREEKYFSTWLVRILINRCKKEYRDRSRIADTGEKLPDIESRDNPYLSVETGEAINALPEKIRTAVVLHYVEGFSVKEIKQILKIPEGTVKSRLSKGRDLLRQSLGE